jgi:hypothetical protein
MSKKYKIVFYGEKELMLTINEFEFKNIDAIWETVTAFRIAGGIYSKSAIKFIVPVESHHEQMQLEELEEPEPKGIPRELADKIRNDHLNRMNCEKKE